MLALDTPGYGESEGPGEVASIDEYARSLAEALDRIEPDRPVDVFGYHTGAFLATEMAVQGPERVRAAGADRRAVLRRPDGPRPNGRARLVHRHELTDRLDQFEARWDFFVTRRAAELPLARGFANFVDELKAWPNDWFTHHALFDYPAEARLPRVHQPVLVINPDSALAAASSLAAQRIPNARVVALDRLSGPILDLGADLLAATMRDFLAD